MQQILLRLPIPGTERVLTFYGYGAMLCLGFVLGILVAARRAKRLGQSPDVIYNAALLAFLGGLIGARAFYVIQYGEHFSSAWDLLKIWEGGLTYYGGLLLAAVGVIGYLAAARLPVLYWCDICAPSLALGLAFGRLGCFMNGCCFGDVCHPGWGIVWPAGSIPWLHYAEAHLKGLGLPSLADGGATTGALAGALAAVWQPPSIQPYQLLAAANALLLFALLCAMFPLKRRQGQILFMFILLYSVSRFFEEFLRADEDPIYLLGVGGLLKSLGFAEAAARLPGLTISQNVSIVMAAAAAAGLVWLARSRRPELRADFVPQPAPAAKPADDRRPKRRKDKRS